MPKRLFHLYIGAGLAPRAAALGLATRGASRKLRVLLIGTTECPAQGEVRLLEAAGINVSTMAGFPVSWESKAEGEAPSIADYDMVALDGFVNSILTGSISKAEAIHFINSRPPGIELVLTGSAAPEWLLDMADYATVMQTGKQPT